MPKYENENLMGGPINAIAWTEDGKKIMAVGGGAKRAVAINIDGGSSAGDCSIGHNKTHYCVDIKQTKPLFSIFGGEENDLQYYKAQPFKYEKSINKVHTGFINACGFSPDGSHFVTVSQDKQVKIFSSET